MQIFPTKGPGTGADCFCHRRKIRFRMGISPTVHMRGRKPKPTALKVLQGNPGKRALPDDEPEPVGEAEMPSWLKPKAAVVWMEYAPILTEIGLLTSADSEKFAQWCTLAARFRAQGANMPAALIARMDAMASTFGMDPSSRSRLGGGQKKQKSNAFQKLG